MHLGGWHLRREGIRWNYIFFVQKPYIPVLYVIFCTFEIWWSRHLFEISVMSQWTFQVYILKKKPYSRIAYSTLTLILFYIAQWITKNIGFTDGFAIRQVVLMTSRSRLIPQPRACLTLPTKPKYLTRSLPKGCLGSIFKKSGLCCDWRFIYLYWIFFIITVIQCAIYLGNETVLGIQIMELYHHERV